MGWAHEAVAMQEVLGFVRRFVDILILAGGRTSSGACAKWRSGDVQKALRWALFEEVFKNLRDSGQYEDSARELDAALVELTSSPDFPKVLLKDCSVKSQTIDKFLLWKQWREQCLSHLLDERTIRIVSGSNLIFSSPKEQWKKVF